MTFRYLTFFLLFPVLVYAQGEWIKVNSPTEQNLNALFLYDSLNFWAAGDSGTIIFSSDGGNNWSIQPTDAKYSITDLHFTDSLNGRAVGLSTVPPFTMMYETHDGGLSWLNRAYEDEVIALRTIFFTDELTGYAGGGNGFIVKTVDGGERWTETRVDSFRLDVNDIVFINDSTGFACGGIRDFSGVIWKTTDYGENWLHTIIPFEPVWEIHFIDSVNYLGIGGDFEYGTGIMRSTDAGENWFYESLDIRGVGTSISFRTDKEVWGALGSDKVIIYSLDSGYTWTPIPSPDSSSLYDLEFSDSLNGIAVGSSGSIFKYRNKIINSAEEVVHPDDFVVYQNYPNPFNSQTIISYSLPEASDVTIRITDILGNNLIKHDGYKSAGVHSRSIDMNKYAGGVYFYSVSYRGKVFSGKMVYLK